MTKFYATHYDNDGVIGRDADIHVFDTRGAAEAFLRSAFDAGDLAEEGLCLTIEPGTWSDCWIKSLSPVRIGERWYAPFSRSQLIVQSPGSHPGGRMWWVTPSPEVLVARTFPTAAAQNDSI